MKKNIRIAAALCAAVFALPVLAGCDNGGLTDETVDGNGSASGSNGGTSQGGTSGGGTGNTGDTGNSGNGGTSGGNTGNSQDGTSGGDTGNTGNTGGTGDSGNGGTSGGNTGTSQGGTGEGGDTGDTGNTGDTGDSGNGDTSGGTTGNVAQNLFKGKTIEHIYNKRYDDEDGSWEENYRKTSITFTTDTTGTYVIEYRYSDSDSEQPDEETNSYDIAYSLEALNGKNFLFINVDDSAVDAEFDEYVNKYYQGISAETKGLLRKTYGTMCYYYEFTDDNMVRITNDYYAGDMGKGGGSFHSNASDSGVYTSLYFSRDSLNLYYTKNEKDESGDWNYTRKTYWGVPQFTNNDFTVTMYREEETENGYETYVEIGSLAGTYAIEGTGVKCDGTITFTQLPTDLQNLFAASYQIRNYDPEDDEDRYVYWQEFTIVADTE